MNQTATDFMKARFYSGQITGEELMRRVEAEVRRDIAAEIEQLRGERDETAKELQLIRTLHVSEKQAKIERGDMLVEAQALVSERESRLTNIKLLLEPIYGSTNYAPIGSVIDRALKICDL